MLSHSFEEKELVLLCVLKGSIVFTADLMKKIQIPLEVETMKVSSYGSGTKTSGAIKIQFDWQRANIEDCDVVVVEDIIDTGRTLNDILALLRTRNPLSLHVVALLEKPSRRQVNFTPDLSLFTVPDVFVIGYGLDCAEYYRNLPYIGVLKPEVYEK